MTGPRADDADVELSVPNWRPRQTIGAFAQAVGLSPSALRQYGESGLLAPIEVDERTGYRYYSAAQQQRAIWIRRLRDAGIELSKIRIILDGDPTKADSLLDGWLHDAEARHLAASELIADLRLSLRMQAESNPLRRTRARFDGTVLAAAIDQALAASDRGSGRVLLDVRSGAVSVVGMNQYLLVARLSVAADVDGPSARTCFDADGVAQWLAVRRRVDLIVDAPIGRDGTTPTVVRFFDDARETLTLTSEPDLFPHVAEMVEDSTGHSTRVVFSRADVLCVTKANYGSLVLRTQESGATLGRGDDIVTGSSRGGAFALEISDALLTSVAEAASGPLLTCDVEGQERPLTWRAPSQPDFVALFMPRVT